MSLKLSELLLVLEGPINFWCLWRFWMGFRNPCRDWSRGVPKWSENLLSVYLQRKLLIFSFRTILSAVSDLVFGLLVSTWSSVGGLFCIFLVPKGSLFSRGSKILGGTDPHLWGMSWELFSLPSCFVVCRRKIPLGISYLISDRITLLVVFPFNSVEEERIK